MSWDEQLAAWWLGEVEADPAYRDIVVPLAVAVLAPRPGGRYLDLGCGEGQVMRAVADAGAVPIGCDAAPMLAARAAGAGPVVVSRLPDLSWAADGAFDGAYAVLVLEHLVDLEGMLEAAARVVRPDGVLAVVANHPAYTAPGSAPVMDPTDGEILWRWGPYLDEGASDVPAGEGAVTFHHRPMGRLLTAAAAAGWCLDRLVEEGVGEAQAATDPLLAAQRHIPRLLAARWHRDPGARRGPGP
jgi:SAM-dependent methyltransferase